MIEVKYCGRLGNQCFQYCLGRILAEQLGYRLKADPIPGFPDTKEKVGGHDYSSYPIQMLPKQRTYPEPPIDFKSILQDNTKRHIVLNGCFQRYDYYRDYKDSIRNNWLVPDMSVKDQIEPNDIAVCVRRTDYLEKSDNHLYINALPFSYYKDALEQADYDRVFIVTDDARDPFVRRLKRKYNAIVRSDEMLADFGFIMLFNKMIIANGSFHWWAAFLSKAKEIYFPIPLSGYWSPQSKIDLKVDEDRYIYIKCRESAKVTFADKRYRAKKSIKSVRWLLGNLGQTIFVKLLNKPALYHNIKTTVKNFFHRK